MSPTAEVRDDVRDALCLIGITIEKMFAIAEVSEQEGRNVEDVLRNLGEANDILRDTYNRW